MRRRRAILITLFLLTALITATGLWLRAQRRQYALNRELIAALVKGDGKQALALVNEGADPNTRYEPTPVPSLPDLFKQWLHHSPPATNDSLTAFSIACGGNWKEEAPFQEMWRVRLSLSRRSDDPLLIAIMLRHGAQVNEHDKDLRSTPLFWAINSGSHHEGTIRVLLEHGANVNWKNMYGLTPIIIEGRHPEEAIIRLLLDYGTDVNARTEDGETVWSGANWLHPDPGVVRLLLEHGANPNSKDYDGNTALHCVVWMACFPFKGQRANDLKDCIRQLMAHGANPNLSNKAGETPFQIARQRKRPDIVALLRHYGARK